MIEQMTDPALDPIQLAQSLAMSLSITDTDRFALVDLLHELAEHRRRHGPVLNQSSAGPQEHRSGSVNPGQD